MFYELRVNGEPKRIDADWAEVTTVARSRARLRAPGGAAVRPGFRVEFEIDRERLTPGNTVAAAREHLGNEEADELARRYLRELEPETRSQPSAPAQSAPAPPVPPEPSTQPAPERSASERSQDLTPVVAMPRVDILRIRGGSYPIGLDLDVTPASSAKYYNESPRHDVDIDYFWIDARPARLEDVDFARAQAVCEARGMRLPTEFEWEIAATHPDFETMGRLEWTSSWYLPYPGNRHAEEEYGKRFRVVRGPKDSDELRPQERRFSDPEQLGIGFRCDNPRRCRSRWQNLEYSGACQSGRTLLGIGGPVRVRWIRRTREP